MLMQVPRSCAIRNYVLLLQALGNCKTAYGIAASTEMVYLALGRSLTLAVGDLQSRLAMTGQHSAGRLQGCRGTSEKPRPVAE